MASENFDVLIVGGGLVGSVLAIALKDSPLKVGLIEAYPFEKEAQRGLDGRSFALSDSSIRILQQLNLWQVLSPYACPIKKIHVSERHGWAQARLDVRDYQIDAFGAVIEHDYLMGHFYDVLEKASNVELITPAVVETVLMGKDDVSVGAEQGGEQTTFKTKVLIAADGANSVVRKALNIPIETHDYYQHALVCNVKLNRSHRNTAYERFMGEEMMAMLPLTEHRQALVWAMDEALCQERKRLSDSDFLSTLQKVFGYRLGRFIDVGQRNSFPLAMSYLTKTVFERAVFIGNAAHSLHPIAGQGFNLGLRDVAFLAELLLAKSDDVAVSLSKLQRLRESDQANTRHFTHGLIKVFSKNGWPASLLRSLGLCLFDNLPPAKNELVHFAAGFSGKNSRLVSGLSTVR